MTVREVPPSAYQAIVAYPSPGFWRQLHHVAGRDRPRPRLEPFSRRLVRYERSGAGSTSGADPCGDGTIAFVPTVDLFAWPMFGESENRRNEVRAKLAAVAGQILVEQGADRPHRRLSKWRPARRATFAVFRSSGSFACRALPARSGLGQGAPVLPGLSGFCKPVTERGALALCDDLEAEPVALTR